MKHFSFGDSPEMSDHLLQLVIEGRKTGTSWAAIHGDCETIVGEEMIITDYKNNPRVLIETTKLKKVLFEKVGKEFARSEGEGDQSLEHWRKQHKDYFRREGTYSPDMEVYCQSFKVIKIYPN